MKPLAVFAALLVLLGAAGLAVAVWWRGPGLTLSEARLTPMGPGHALTLKIDNPGPADRLHAVSVEGAAAALVGADVALPVPAGGAPSLAMDGAHAIVTGLADAEEGRLVRVTLTFEGVGDVATRARVDAPSQMAHDVIYEVPAGEIVPHVRVSAEPRGDGWVLTVETENFTFDSAAVDGPHQPGRGHAHLYVGGLKIGRVYATKVDLGALPPGKHEARITLNTNDHRTYAVDGVPVSATVPLVQE